MQLCEPLLRMYPNQTSPIGRKYRHLEFVFRVMKMLLAIQKWWFGIVDDTDKIVILV